MPAIGRVMSLGFAGDGGASDPFWRHGQLGPSLAPDENGWINYGGDKAWPAPQSEWQRMVGKGWPPPVTFDARPHTATMKPSAIELVSPVDPAYGLRVRRTVGAARRRRCSSTRPTRRWRGRRSVSRSGRSRSSCRPIACSRCCRSASAFAGGHRSVLPAAPKDLTRRRPPAGSRPPPDGEDDDRERRRCAAVGRARAAICVIENVSRRHRRDRRAAARRRARADLHQPRRRRALRRARAPGPARRPGARPAHEPVGSLPAVRRQNPDPLEEARRVFADELSGHR